jgi:hypothetical protein
MVSMLSGDSTQESWTPSLIAPTFYKCANKFTSKFAKELRRSHMSRFFLNIFASFVLNSKYPDRDFFCLFDGFHDGFPNWKDSWCCGGESEPKGNHSMTTSRDKLLLPFQHHSLPEFLISPWPCKLVHQSTHSNFQVPSCFSQPHLFASFSWTNCRDYFSGNFFAQILTWKIWSWLVGFFLINT